VAEQALADALRIAAFLSLALGSASFSLEHTVRFVLLCVVVSLARYLPLTPRTDWLLCAALLAAAWGGPLDVYRHAWVDALAHFVVPAVAGAALSEAAGAGLRAAHGEIDRRRAAAIALAFSLAAATIWELYEWAASRAIAGNTIHVDYNDTMSDLTLGAFGGAALCQLAVGVSRIRSSWPAHRAGD
jgi:hypothetical protein